MLDRIKSELELKASLHEELVGKYNKKLEEKAIIERELAEIEREIIHTQGAVKAINDLGVKMMEDADKTQNVEDEA